MIGQQFAFLKAAQSLSTDALPFTAGQFAEIQREAPGKAGAAEKEVRIDLSAWHLFRGETFSM